MMTDETKAIRRRLSIIETEGEGSSAGFKFDKTLPEERQLDDLQERMRQATGSARNALDLMTAVASNKSFRTEEQQTKNMLINSAADQLEEFSPKDVVEGQLASQLLVLNEHAMNFLLKAAHTDRVDFANVYANIAAKLINRHHEALAALLRYRRGNEQKICVEHVHVAEGGKAIIGNVQSGGVGKNEQGPVGKV